MALLCAGILLVIVGIAVSTLVWQGWQLLALLLMGTMLLLIGLALFLIGQVRIFQRWDNLAATPRALLQGVIVLFVGRCLWGVADHTSSALGLHILILPAAGLSSSYGRISWPLPEKRVIGRAVLCQLSVRYVYRRS